MNIVWLRNDLRLEDNPALYHACNNGPTYCVYTVTPGQWEKHDDAPAKITFWRERLIALQDELHALNIPLKVLYTRYFTQAVDAVISQATDLSVKAIYINNEYPLNEKKRDDYLATQCHQRNIHLHRFDGDVVMPPGSVKTQQNTMYHVFTPFSRQWHKLLTDTHLQLLPPPQQQSALTIKSDNIKTQWPLEKDKTINYRHDIWPASTSRIHKCLQKFCLHTASNYKEKRDIPSIKGTSTLSPYLCAGAVSVRQCLYILSEHIEDWRSNQWATELIWREFYRHLTAIYPHISRSENFVATQKPIQWDNNEKLFVAWCNGETGYPIVDAAMKQLKQTGWMHNRLRMITAAFLTKLLLIDWRKGERFFMQHLLDGDYASNNGGWQWSASTGADAAPYFRIFNPQRQSERFDPEGLFIKKFLPELQSLPHKAIHNPTPEQRRLCNYPEPIIDYKFARERALSTFTEAMKKTK